MNAHRLTYPAGALVRATEICRNTKTGQPGLLPINRATWYKWLAAGKVPKGTHLAGSRTVVWPIEVVRSLGQPAAQVAPESAPAT
ncbi:AlpA family transcriptional regulator [Rhizobacter sp. Root1221]|uniref:helix-turn-helix transcriptional regulator n=1 Tax=Rhizobacter sp. Root1221 TaxID=1736433 RepID=UPI000ACFAE1D|nr:AlpA family transcriptional regulator [Rhizobacter sp. Root1221]